MPAKVATPTCTLHGVACVATGIDLDLGNEVVHRDLIGAADVLIVAREPKGEITIEAVPVATKNWFAVADAGTRAALSLVHGTVAGNIVELSAPNVQIIDPSYEAGNGVLLTKLGLRPCESAGDDDLTLIVR